MTWLHPGLFDPALRDAYGEVVDLAEWSEWRVGPAAGTSRPTERPSRRAGRGQRALADPEWLEARVASLRTRGPSRTKEWVCDAVARRQLGGVRRPGGRALPREPGRAAPATSGGVEPVSPKIG